MLDAATGTGFAAIAAASRVGRGGHVYGVDISAGMLRDASVAAAKTGLTNIQFIEDDASLLPRLLRPLALTRRLDATAALLGSAAALGSTVLAVYWSTQIARGVPDAYAGQNWGGLLLSVAILSGAFSGLVRRSLLTTRGGQSVGIVLEFVSMVCLATAVYFYEWSVN